MMIFRYHMVGGQSFDEAAPAGFEVLPLAEVREHLAKIVSPPVHKPEDAYLAVALHIMTTDGHAHLLITHNLVDIEIMLQDDPAASVQADYAAYQERMAQASKDMKAHAYQPDQTEPGPGHLRLAASNGDQVQRRSHGGPFGGHTFT